MGEFEERPEVKPIRGVAGPQGSLAFLETNIDIPFEVKRVYFIYDVPPGTTRGLHAHKLLHQFLIAVSGSLTVTVDSGREKQSFTLNSQGEGLLLPPGFWRELENFSSDAVCLVLASEHYMESDYIRRYEDFLAWKGNAGT
jgi:dTDP-4-dehydrorhamnose 3,5-epimerase-like enzyme